MQRSEFTVTYPPGEAHPSHRAIMAGTAISRMELLMWGPRSAVTTLSWFDGAPDAVETVIAAGEAARTTEIVPGEDGTYAFVRQDAYEFDDAIMDIVTDAEVVFLPPITFHESGEATFEAVGKASLLSAFHEALSDRLDTRIDRVSEFHRWSTGADVTERQREAVAAALSVGYYEVPRSGTVADVAERLDCSTSTAGELLRKAEAAIVRAAADGF